MVKNLFCQEDAALLNFSVESPENGENIKMWLPRSYLTFLNKLVRCLISKKNISHEATKVKNV